jgi:hypothetical protein
MEVIYKPPPSAINAPAISEFVDVSGNHPRRSETGESSRKVGSFSEIGQAFSGRPERFIHLGNYLEISWTSINVGRYL